MKDYVIVTDSSCDITQEYADELELVVVPLQFTVAGKTYNNYLDNRECSTEEFYEILEAGNAPKTNQPSPEAFLKEYEKIYQDGKDILVLSFTSGLSGTYNSACLGKEMFLEQHPDAKILAVDTMCASSGEGLIVSYAAELKKEGKTMEEVVDFVEKNKFSVCHWFTVADLDQLRRGGRVKPTAAFIGNLLNIKPVLHVDYEGHLIPMSKKIGRKNSIKALAEKFAELYDKEKCKRVFICHGHCIDEANYLKSLINKASGIEDIRCFEIGPVIGSHSGKGTLAVFFIGTNR